MFKAQWLRMSVLSVALVGAGEPLDNLQDHADDVSRTIDGAKQVLEGFDALLSGGKSSSDERSPPEDAAEEEDLESPAGESESFDEESEEDSESFADESEEYRASSESESSESE